MRKAKTYNIGNLKPFAFVNASYYERNFVVLNTSLNEELINEGIARELISRVQQLRKTKDFEVSDRIILYYESSPQLDEVMKSFEDLIKAETLSEKFQAKKELSESFEVNNLTIKIDFVYNIMLK